MNRRELLQASATCILGGQTIWKRFDLQSSGKYLFLFDKSMVNTDELKDLKAKYPSARIVFVQLHDGNTMDDAARFFEIFE